jgi:hypothetical protein
MLRLGDHLPPPAQKKAVIIVFQKMCVKTYMSFGKKYGGKKTLWNWKKEGNGFWRNWLVSLYKVSC